MEFKDCGLKPGLLKALELMEYHTMTPIQEKVIKFAIKGENIVGQSQTGTGKTSAFLLPLLHRIDTNKKGLQALILAPTRELANQIGEEIFALTKFYRVNAVCIYGGASPVPQEKALRKGPSIIVATPGRLMDFVGQKIIDLGSVEFFVLDEVDRMLDMGFIRDIEKIRKLLTRVKQTYTFSATLSPEIKKIIESHVATYEFIKVGETITVDKIDHSHISVPHEDKLLNVTKLIASHPKDKVIIFTQTKRNTKTIFQTLEKEGLKVGMLNGNMSQNKRMSTLKEFKEGIIRVMITTDVAARGLNMDNVGLVINFDVPHETESYIHRIGRTGRAGASGKAIMLVSDLEQKLMANIEKVQNIKIKKSEHQPVSDVSGAFKNIRLSRTTDKKTGRGGGGGRPGGFQGRSNGPRTERDGERKFGAKPSRSGSSSTGPRAGRDDNKRFGPKPGSQSHPSAHRTDREGGRRFGGKRG